MKKLLFFLILLSLSPLSSQTASGTMQKGLIGLMARNKRTTAAVGIAAIIATWLTGRHFYEKYKKTTPNNTSKTTVPKDTPPVTSKSYTNLDTNIQPNPLLSKEEENIKTFITSPGGWRNTTETTENYWGQVVKVVEKANLIKELFIKYSDLFYNIINNKLTEEKFRITHGYITLDHQNTLKNLFINEVTSLGKRHDFNEIEKDFILKLKMNKEYFNDDDFKKMINKLKQ